MKTILRIAKLELNILFYSPIAWFLLVVLLFQCGMAYTGNLGQWVNVQEMGLYKDTMSSLTDRIFGVPFGMLGVMLSKIYLYLPLLTMGLMSREFSSGTIKLLYSSPMKISEIILGKFLAMMVYNLIMVSILAVFMIAGYINIVHADVGQLMCGLLGFYLLLCTYAAIGLFVSCLTSYQVVAALCTFVLFALLAYIGFVWQSIDFVRDLTYSLSISGRAEKIILGLLTTKDVIYFLNIIYIFLGLCICKLLADCESRTRLFNYSRYAGVLVSAVFISYISSRPQFIGYYDATANKTQTLSKNTQAIVKAMADSTLEISAYDNLLDDETYYLGAPSQRNEYMDRWEPYLRFKSNIKFKYYYYYDSTANVQLYKQYPGKSLRYMAENATKIWDVNLNDFKTPEQMRTIIDLKGEKSRFVMQLKYKGKTTFLRVFQDQFVVPMETEIAAALKRLSVDVPKVAFVQGELERSIDKFGDRSYKALTNDITFTYALINQGFDVQSLSLKNQDIPADISVLVIADPKTSFEPVVLDKIKKYIASGGNLLIAGEPGKQAILNPLIGPLGVQLSDGIIVQKSKDFAPDLALTYLTPLAASFSKILQQNRDDSVAITMPNVAPLSYGEKSDFIITPLLNTDEKNSWQVKGKVNVDSADIVYDPAKGDLKKSFATALSLTRDINGKKQRIIVTGDADFLSNNELGRHMQVRTDNYYFSTSVFGWLSYGEFPIDTTMPKSKDNSLNISGKGLVAFKYFFLWALPIMLIFISAVLLIRRKKQ